MKGKLIEGVFWILLLLPLAGFYVDGTAEWGDDFAAYYSEAKNISEGHPFYKTHFRFCDYNDHYAPPYYPVGFPLLLAPMVKSVVSDMPKLNQYMSLWMFAWGLLTVWFLRRYYSSPYVAAFMILFFLSAYFFECKGRLWSDTPFSFFFLLTIALYMAPVRDVRLWMIAGVSLGFAILIRSLGFVLLLTICLDLLLSVSLRKDRWLWRDKVPKVLVVGICSSLVLLLAHFIFPAPFDTYYFKQFAATTTANVIVNARNYLSLFLGLFIYDPSHGAASIAMSWFILLLLITGLVRQMVFSRDLISLTFICYLLVILLFPDNQGFRYLLPLVPLIIYFSIKGAELYISSGFGLLRWTTVLFLLLMTLNSSYSLLLFVQKNWKKEINYGPFTRVSQRGLMECKKWVPESGLIVCVSPRVVGMLMDRDCSVIPWGDTQQQIKNLAMTHPDYMLAIEERDEDVIINIALAHGDSVIWQQDGLKLYRCKPWGE